jgi:hypothetical protein
MLMPIDRVRLPMDLREWIELCEAGALYDAIAQLFGLEPGSRAEAKRFLFKVVFGATPRPDIKYYAPYQKFLERWPTVAVYLRRMKVLGPSLRAQRATYRPWFIEKLAKGRVARLTQRVESLLVLCVAATRVMTQYPAIPLVTCHDSILTTEQHLPLVTKALQDAFGQIGLTPLIR